uniref:Uncharacterized protein n=1 Tax=Arundo donax TaxID=35708 RepID=A0A0A9GS38_ARUDO
MRGVGGPSPSIQGNDNKRQDQGNRE